MTKKKDKKLTTDEMLFSIDTANRMLAYDIERLSKKLDEYPVEIAEAIKVLRNEISRLNEIIYEDRVVLAKFVKKFFKDTDVFIDPKLAIDGGKKAKK